MRSLETISEYYRELNRKLHEKGFGGGGHKRYKKIAAYLRPYGIRTILDYGCGQGTLRAMLLQKRAEGDVDFEYVVNYDPAIPEWSIKPQQTFNAVTCTDVFEHIEAEYLDNVIKEVFGFANKLVFLHIATHDSNDVLEDGRNAHLIQQQSPWWKDRIKQVVGDEWDLIYDDAQGVITRKFWFIWEKRHA